VANVDRKPYLMREPCRWCQREGTLVMDGYLLPSGGQNVVRCSRCERAAYNAPKIETGEPRRTVRSRPDLREGQRERILERDAGECFLCHRRDGILHVAHALSVADAQAEGWTEDEYMDDANLYASCEECNLGLKSKSMEARIFLRLIQLRLRGRQR
jgi:5-methylcytosine-specific restriction endonuclease McrA